MDSKTLEKLRYPIGQFVDPTEISRSEIDRCIDEISALPQKLSKEVIHLSKLQLDTPYRVGGWTIRQLVHHLPDSHLNGYVRVKCALTETQPVIKPYTESAWANLADGKSGNIDVSLNLLHALHERWAILLRELSSEEFKRSYIHPENNHLVTLDSCIALYTWHGKHHLAHIVNLKERMKW